MRKLTVLLTVFIVAMWLIGSCARKEAKEVVIYTSLDQIFSEPILREFEEKTGIKVKPVYDTEAAKTTGLVNRLIAEKDNPQADVFWNNEIARTIMLKKKGILAPYVSAQAQNIPPQFKDKDGYWAGFAARARVIIVNTDLVLSDVEPTSIFDFKKEEWRGDFALANPLFGTTATHAAALFVYLGNKRAKEYFNALKENDVVIVPGNSTSRDRVRDGELKAGFTDTDDAWIAIAQGKPVKMIFPDKEGIGTLLIPNTISLIRGAPHSFEAKKLIDFILTKEVESKLAYSPSMQIPLRRGIDKPEHVPDFNEIKAMEVDFKAVADTIEESAAFLQDLFLR